MSRMVERRNDPGFWVTTPRWTRLTAGTLPVCHDCLIGTHEAGGLAPAEKLTKARWHRKSGDTRISLCDFHKSIWAAWVPGQMVIGE